MMRNALCCHAAAIGAAALTLAVGCSQRVPEYRHVDAQKVALIREGLVGEGGAAVAGGSSSQPEPTGKWATLTGTFHFPTSALGQLPKPSPLTVSGDDAAYCTRDGTPLSQVLQFDGTTGAIPNIVIFLADDLSKMSKPELWINPSAAPGNSAPAVFDQKNCVFLSHVLALQVSQPLEIHNSDTKSHNTKLDASKPFNQTIAPGQVLTYQHAGEERQPYKASCSVHPWMTAWILPRQNGYFAVTDKNGNFKIENLPTGVDLTFKVWQEKAGFLEEVTVNGAKTKWPKKGFVQPLEPDQTLTLDVEVDPAPFVK